MSTDSSRQLLPEGLADLPPGPGLAVALAGVDLGRLTSADLYTVAVLRSRLVSHEQAELLSTMLTTAYAGYRDDEGQPPPEHCPLDEFSADQLAFTLHLSKIAAARQLDLAEQLIERLPAVFAALSAGRIDLVKARVFVEAVALLNDTTARAVVAKMLGKAESITVGQLRDQLRYRVHQADPGLAKRRQRHSVADRRVFVQLDDDGTATLAGVNLPPDRAAAAANRIERLARVAKADGDVRNLDQLKADAMLALLCGAPFVLHPPNDPHTADADEENRAAEAAIHANNPHPFPQPKPTGKATTGQDGQTTETDATSGADPDPGPDSGADPGSGAGPGAGPGPGADSGPGPGADSGSGPGADSGSGSDSGAREGAGAGGGEPSNLPVRPGSLVDDPFEGIGRNSRTGLRIRPRLHFGNPNRTDPTGAQPPDANNNDTNTPDRTHTGMSGTRLNGHESNMDTPTGAPPHEPDPDQPEPEEPDHDEPDPGEGYQYSEASPDGESGGFDPIGGAGMFDNPLPPRDKHGRVDLDRAPTPDRANLCVCGGIQPAARRGVVNLLVPLTTLMCLTEDPGRIPGWGPVLADIARQVAFDQETNPAWVWSVTDQHGNLLHHGQTKRRPSASERAFVQARDGQCVGPGCRKQATLADIDHRQEPAADGGPAQRANLCVLCRHCHRLKHERGFVIHQISSGSYIWEAPNGRLYMVLPNGDLIQTADDIEPPPPPGYVRAAFGIRDDEDW